MRLLVLALLLSATPVAAIAQDAKSDDVYNLGELQVTAKDRTGENLGGSVISGDVLQTYNKQTVDKALDLIPGTVASVTGGSRNESVVYVRGFDRFQTTLSIDGVRLFLPADNRIDFARFLTADLAEVQVSKGYVSVLDGPGALGGAINLVTTKPTRSLEGDFAATDFFGNRVDQAATQLSGRIGGRTGAFYWQASGAINDRDHWTLPFKYKATALENGRERNHSDSNDWRVNVKAGWQPNDTDEYSINYTKQEGEKNAPYSTYDTTSTRYWDWPYWNTDSLALLTKTQFGDRLMLKTRLYTNGFDNLLSSFDTAAQTTQTLPKAFNSYYNDTTSGGNAELDYDFDPASQLKGVFYARHDMHHEYQDGFAAANVAYHEPVQTNDEWTYSVASEYTRGFGSDVDLTVGASYDWTNLRSANDVNVQNAGGVITYLPVNYALINHDAINGQAALNWHMGSNTRAHLSVSDRTRFPTVFERFSSRMGTAIPNPDVKPERAINYEFGFDTKVGDNITLTGALFTSSLTNALIQIPVTVTGFGLVNQTKNAGSGHYEGFEGSFTYKLSDALDLGGNFTYLQRTLTDPTNPKFQAQGVPVNKAFAYANWRPLSKLTIRPSLEYASGRWTIATPTGTTTFAGHKSGYYKTDPYLLVNLSADYQINSHVTATLAAENLGDQLYELTDGFPEAGRSFYVSLRAKF